METTGGDLIRKAAHGDEDALTCLLEEHHDAVRAAVEARIDRKFRSAFSAEDVLQVTFIEAYLRIKQFKPDGEGAFSRWLHRIAINNVTDSIRELSRAKRPPRHRQIGDISKDDSYVELLASLPGSQTTPSQRASRSEIRRLIDDAIGQLPPDYAQAVRGMDIEGHTAPQLAEQMGRSVGAVHMLRSRAREWMAEILGESTLFFGKSS